MKYPVVLHKSAYGYDVHCPLLPGCHSQGDTVEDALENQAAHFVELLDSYIDNYHRESGKEGILTTPFDTELFGHWWFEGPRFIGKVLRKLNQNDSIKVITLGNHLEKNRPQTIISMPEGSWGQGGFHYIWLNEWTEWTWKHVYAAEDQMVELANKYAETQDEVSRRILNQLAREVLLIESSDWQFLISTWSARDYAEGRLTVHSEHIKRLANILDSYDQSKLLTEQEQVYLAKIEGVDDVFPDIDFTYWRSLKAREDTK